MEAPNGKDMECMNLLARARKTECTSVNVKVGERVCDKCVKLQAFLSSISVLTDSGLF